MGARGFVGSAFARLFDEIGVKYRPITREMAQNPAGLPPCDFFINANGNSRKYLADRDPKEEFNASVESVQRSLIDFRYRKYIFLSSGDVYPDTSSPALTSEASPINLGKVSRYGLHKLLAEHLVQGYTADWLIFRMGGFVGPNIKKNAIFDMLTGSPIWIDPDSELQFIQTGSAARIVWEIATSGVRGEVINLGASGLVNVGDLHRRIGSNSTFQAQAPKVRFDLNLSKLQALHPQKLPESNAEVDEFVQAVKNDWISL
jgi:nucleoside-diphosphate-sugar epimerase